MSPSYRLYWIRGLVYILFLVLLGSVLPHIVLEGAGLKGSQIFLIATLVTAAQCISVFLPLRRHATLALFFCDALFTMILVRVSGSASSPFLVMFPVIAALGPVTFQNHYFYLIMGACLLFSGVALGWGVGIVGSWIAIIAVGFLSWYLLKLLRSSEISLEKSEVARRRLENLQKVILANIPSGLVSVDSDGAIIQINTVGEQILEISEEAFLRKSIEELIPGVELDAHNELRVEDRARSRKLLDFVNHRGKLLKLGYSTAVLADPDGDEILGTLLVFQDLTEVIKLENEVRMNEKLAAIGKLAAGIAHEIRNPLAGISGSAQLLAGSVAVNEEDKQLLNIIQRESSRLDGLITEFLEYVRPQDVQLKKIDIVDIATQVGESLKVSSKWKDLNTALNFDMPSAEVWVNGEANKLTQVVMNLVLNAGQAGAQNVQVSVRSENEKTFLEVRDDGSGISLENQARLFEPFFTTKDSGTGLGLAICYKMIEAMGGRIDVISPAHDFCANNGSLFKIELRTSDMNGSEG